MDLNRKTLVQRVSDSTGYTQKATAEVVAATLDAISDSLAKGEGVRLI
jgi:nucleoid DNA-binding protein